MSTNQAETASAQFTLKLVRELSTLIANGENQKAWHTWHMWATPIASLVESQAKRNAELEAENKLLREEWERMNECLVDYVSGCEEFKHRPHCYCLPAVELLSTLKFSPSQK